MSEQRWSVLARDLTSGEVIAADHPEELLPTASLGKLFLLIHLAELLDRDPAAGAVLLGRDAVDPVADSGLWQHLSVAALSVEDCARLTGSVSDNLATNVLLDHLGLAEVQATAARLAPRGSMLHDRVRDVRRPEDPPTLSTGCAADWVEVVGALPARVRDWLATSVDLSLVASVFDLDPLAHTEEDPRVWNKTGSDPGTRADVGVVEHAGRRVGYAVIARYDPEDHSAVLRRMRRIGAELLSWLRGSAGPRPR